MQRTFITNYLATAFWVLKIILTGDLKIIMFTINLWKFREAVELRFRGRRGKLSRNDVIGQYWGRGGIT